MLITLISWLYISALCMAWGILILMALKSVSGDKNEFRIHPSLLCFFGLAGITVFSSILSLFMPLGGWTAQLLIIAPCLVLIFKKKSLYRFFDFKKYFHPFHIVFVLLLFSCLLVVLIMSSWQIDNQDTLAYHAQIIQWIEKYKAVPGIAQLHVRYGLQSSWFISCALFSFKFLRLDALTFINSTILSWYFIFIVSRINKYFFDSRNSAFAFVWLGILIISLLSYTQVRLAATSGNPDFIAVLYIWLSFYLLFNSKKNESSAITLSLIIIVGLFAIAIKLSAVPIIILAGYCTYRLIRIKKIKLLLISILICLVIVVPFISRNIISSGYPIFPSSIPDIANVDWKLDKQLTVLVKNYVTAYARTKSGATKEEIEKTISARITEWLPIWWRNQSQADKAIIMITALSILMLIINIRKFLRSDQITKVALITALAGIVFWFIQAPDPRFGFGFIITLPVIVLSLYISSAKENRIDYRKKILLGATFMIGIVISSYFIYRVANFFSPPQLLAPFGIKKIEYKTVNCNGVSINIPSTRFSCGMINVPCAYDSCKTFEPRGKSITDGFKSK